MAINFSDKVLVTNPTTFFLGRFVLCLGIFAIFVGGITHFAGDVLLPDMAWCVIGASIAVTGMIVMTAGLRRN